MDNRFPHLLSPFSIGKIQFKNRMCVSPMGMFYMETSGPFNEYSARAQEYVTHKAKGGYGLMFMGTGFFPDYQVDATNPNFALLNHQDEFIKAAITLNERADFFGMKLIQQLSMGTGRIYEGMYAPSAVEVYQKPDVLSPIISKDQIRLKIDQIIEASKVMKASGFQGVEMHAMHWGYLLDQFAMSITNHREDEYGGCLENRLLVAKELVEGIKQENGDDFIVSMRFGLKSYMKALNKSDYTGEHEAGRTIEEAVEIAKLLEKYGYDCLNVDAGVYESYYMLTTPSYMPDGHVIPMAAEVKKAVNIPVLCGSRMKDPYMSEQALAEGKIDAVVLGRATIADPDYARKIEMGTPEKIRPCISCNIGCVWRAEHSRTTECAVNPLMDKELIYMPHKTLTPKRIAIIGGGIAGMEIARTCTMRGHECTIYEKSDVLGGNLIAAGMHEFKSANMNLVKWYREQMKELRVRVELNCEMDAEKIKALHPDIVVLAVGAESIMPKSIKGIDHPKCASAVDAALGKIKIGENVVVIGGGLTGCEEALAHVLNGRNVTLVEASEGILKASSMIHESYSGALEDMFEYYGVKVMANTKIVAVTDEGAVVESVKDGEQTTLPADTVIMSIGLKSLPSMARSLQGSGIEVYEVGDGKRVGNVYTTINGAYGVARLL